MAKLYDNIETLPAIPWDMSFAEVRASLAQVKIDPQFFQPMTAEQESDNAYGIVFTRSEADAHLFSCGCGGCIICALEKHPDAERF